MKPKLIITVIVASLLTLLITVTACSAVTEKAEELVEKQEYTFLKHGEIAIDRSFASDFSQIYFSTAVGDVDWFNELQDNDPDGNYIAYYHNVNSWTNVYASAWSGSGTSKVDYLGSGGTKMTAIAGGNGWYTINVNKNAQKIKFGNGSTNTAELTLCKHSSRVYYFAVTPDCVNDGTSEGWQCSACGQQTTRAWAAFGHTFDDNVTCHDRKCSSCGVTVGATTEHEFLEEDYNCIDRRCKNCNAVRIHTVSHTLPDDLTCHDRVCSVCSTTVKATTSHSYNANATCACGDVNWTTAATKAATGLWINDEYALYGKYPQTKVSDSTLISSLNSQAGTLPTATNSRNWTSYHYIVNCPVGDTATLYFHNSSSWSKVYAYAWSGCEEENNVVEYLGADKGTETAIYQDGWYKITVNTAAEYIRFSNGSSSVTSDFTIDWSKTWCFTNSNGEKEWRYENYAWYIDLTYSGEKYRGVYFTSYRPFYVTAESSLSNSYQYNNGYSTSTAYWFKYEPLSWQILTQTSGQALLLCATVIDAQEYYSSVLYTAFSHNGGNGYANDYSLSNIRKWLNETFYNVAFSSTEKSKIITVTVDNSAKSSNPSGASAYWNSGSNSYVCSNTSDKVFLLSEEEVTNVDYGFYAYDVVDPSRSKLEEDGKLARGRTASDYAMCQGCWVNNKGIGNYWLRSPYCDAPNCAHGVENNGMIYYGDYVTSVNYGVVPAIKINK